MMNTQLQKGQSSLSSGQHLKSLPMPSSAASQMCGHMVSVFLNDCTMVSVFLNDCVMVSVFLNDCVMVSVFLNDCVMVSVFLNDCAMVCS